GNLGLIVAEDALSFYLFFALMSFSSYGLIVHRRSADALRAGRVYIALVVLGEVLMFAGFLTAAWQAGTVYIEAMAANVRSDLVIGLLVAGFAIKAGALPLHVWLPLAHPVAPVPASAVLSGAMIKAGLLGWLRFLPLGTVALPEWSAVFVTAGLAAAVFGMLVGLLQDQSKTVLAYSSISQMGFMTVCIGIGMAAPDAWPMCLSAVLLYALHHAFAKGTLFLGVGVAAASGKDTVQRWLVGSGLSFAAMALAGLPMTSGAIAKSALSSLSGYLWPDGISLMLSMLAIGTTLLMARFLYLVWPRGKHESPIAAGLWIPWTFALLAVALCTLLWPRNHSPAPHTLSVAAIWHALWPGVTGATIALAVLWRNRKSPIRLPLRIPAGDILWLMSRLSIAIGQVWSVLVNHLRHFIGRLQSCANRAYRRIAALDPAGYAEATFHHWTVSGLAFICLLLAVFLALGFAASS
ncbi:MAG: complex I subunit 5 family protein, partial [Gammaproteobacteria bacterium]|nr:complex I subunit 5 family protein [Gammaproteobacteria bacterium]